MTNPEKILPPEASERVYTLGRIAIDYSEWWQNWDLNTIDYALCCMDPVMEALEECVNAAQEGREIPSNAFHEVCASVTKPTASGVCCLQGCPVTIDGNPFLQADLNELPRVIQRKIAGCLLAEAKDSLHDRRQARDVHSAWQAFMNYCEETGLSPNSFATEGNSNEIRQLAQDVRNASGTRLKRPRHVQHAAPL